MQLTLNSVKSSIFHKKVYLPFFNQSKLKLAFIKNLEFNSWMEKLAPFHEGSNNKIISNQESRNGNT